MAGHPIAGSGNDRIIFGHGVSGISPQQQKRTTGLGVDYWRCAWWRQAFGGRGVAEGREHAVEVPIVPARIVRGSARIRFARHNGFRACANFRMQRDHEVADVVFYGNWRRWGRVSQCATVLSLDGNGSHRRR